MIASQDFHPSDTLKRTAETLFAALAFEAAIGEKVTAYQQRILADNEFRMAPEKAALAGHDPTGPLPRITEAKRSYMMSTVDAERYYALCDEARADLGLSVGAPGNCPLLEAEDLTRQAQRAFIEAFASEIDEPELLKCDRYPALRERTLELGMRLMAPFVDRSEIMERMVGSPPSESGHGDEIESERPHP